MERTVHNIQTGYSDSANVHIASTINFNARTSIPDNDSLGRNLTDADVANDQCLKEREGLKYFFMVAGKG